MWITFDDAAVAAVVGLNGMDATLAGIAWFGCVIAHLEASLTPCIGGSS